MEFSPQIKTAVVGLGKLGLPLACVLASKNMQVIGLDANNKLIQSLNAGCSASPEPYVQELLTENKERLTFTAEYSRIILESEITFLVLPTPSCEDGYFSNEYLLAALKPLCLALASKQTYHLIVIVSTVMPGAMDHIIQPAIEKYSGKVVGMNLGLCYNPEFIAIGSVISDMLRPDFVLIGESDTKAGNQLEQIYHKICNNQPSIKRMNFVNAEITKLAVNSFVTTKISYANMLGNLCEKLANADVDIVTNAIGSDTRIGPKYLKSAVAYGGPCFPRDNIALCALAEKLGMNAEISLATTKVNHAQVLRIEKIIQQLNCKKIGIWGLAYKTGTVVMECSPGLELASHLRGSDYDIIVFDDLIETRQIQSHSSTGIQVAKTTEELLNSCEVLILMTSQNLLLIDEESCYPKFVLDCWRSLDSKNLPSDLKIIKLGKNIQFLKEESYATT